MGSTQGNTSSLEQNRHLQLAAEHVSRRWFPVDPQLLARVRENLENGYYEEKPDVLVADLKQDLALFTWCIKALGEGSVARQAGRAGLPPSALLGRTPYKELLRVLDPQNPALSSHRLTDATQEQSLRLREVIISASTAELVSTQADIEQEQAFTAAIFRQLGLTLISWNYPHVYSRAVKALRAPKDLDLALTRMLGFSPALLGITIARQCCLVPEVRFAAGDKTAVVDCENPSDSERICESLEKICKVGEALARSADPDQYPGAQHDWQFARAEILTALGPQGLSILSETLGRRCEHYTRCAPQVFTFSFDADWNPDKVSSKPPQTLDAFQNNHYLQQCSTRLNERLKTFYTQLDPQAISKDALDEMTRSIIPEAGFPRGCIYLIEPDALMLIPRLPIGRSRPQEFKPIKCEGPISHFHPVAAAFSCKTPIMEENVEVGESLVTYIAAVLGEDQKAGVLYLEPSPRMLAERTHTALITFKALRQAVCDCLGLR